MTEKEKAKAYDEAIERTKKIYGNIVMGRIFPELKERENTLKSFKDEDVHKFMQYIEKQAKAYEFNLPNRSYDIYAFAKDLLVWVEKQYKDKKEINNFDVRPGLYKCVHRMFDGTPEGELLFEIGNVYKCLSKHDRAEFEVSYGHSVYLEDPVVRKFFIPFESKGEQALSQPNERAWLYLVSDVLTWKDGIGQYLDDPRVQELAKLLCSRYKQKLYNSLVISNSPNTGKNEQKSADKVEPKFKVGDWIISSVLGTARIIGVNDSNEYQLEYIGGEQKFSSIDYVNYAYDKWTIQDAKDGDVLALSWLEDKNLWEKIIIFKKYHSEGVKGLHLMPCVEGYGNTFKNGKLAFTDEEVPYHSKTWTCNLHPATKEQRDTLMKAMNDAGYEWVS